MEISYRHLWKAKYANVVRLAKSFGIIAPACECTTCKSRVIEAVARKL
jgi:hypothetical protein